MLKKAILSAGLIAAAGMLAGVGNANASLYPETVSVSNLASRSYAAGAYQATITFDVSQVGPAGGGSYSLSITLDNTSDMKGNANLLKGVEFSLDSGVVDANVASIGLSGSYAQLQSTSPGYGAQTGLTSDSQLNSVKANANWVVASGGAGTYEFFGNQGDLLVASSPQSPGAPYPDANKGVFNSANSTVLVNSPVFVLQITGARSLPAVTLDRVYFGTGSGPGDLSVVPGQPVVPAGPLPIPATLPLVGGGLLGLAALAMRRRRAL